MQRSCARGIAACVLFALLFLTLAAEPPVAGATSPEPLAPPWTQLPLPVLRVTGGFGESRSNHLHAGLDFSTDGHVGAAVRAPFACWVERVRASGVGYGRSLYLHCANGSTVVFGHLDAYAAPVAAWVDSAQRASGQYEQDLWPANRRFRFTAGDTVAWTGESGAGGPHLHMEIRHGDFALDPLRAGIVQPSDAPPRLETLTLEPLDEGSFVQRGAGPFTISLATQRPETLVVVGRMRAVVRSRAGLPGASGVPAWSTELAWNVREWRANVMSFEGPNQVEARLDSISWAGEMAEQDLVLDRGRVTGSMGFILEEPPRFTPRLVHALQPSSDVQWRDVDSTGAPMEPQPRGEPAEVRWRGVIEMGDFSPPGHILFTARDPQGLEVHRTIWLRAPRFAERGPDSLGVSPTPLDAAPRWSFASLEDGRVRLALSDVPAGVRRVRLGVGGRSAPATLRAGTWTAIVPIDRAESNLHAQGVSANGTRWETSAPAQAWPQVARPDSLPLPAGGALVLPAVRTFEPLVLLIRSGTAPGALGATASIEPRRAPLRRPAVISLPLPAGVAPEHVDIYRFDDDGWSSLRANFDAVTRSFRTETSVLGTFALRRDDTPPLVTLLPAARHVPAGPYPRWQLEARVRESGSGLDPSASAFTIDGVRVPSEWDGEEHLLRWRPRRAPSPGTHRVAIRVVDRAGNAAQRTGSFVLDSAQR